MSYQIDNYPSPTTVLDQPSFSAARPSLQFREVEPPRAHERLLGRDAAQSPGGLAPDQDAGRGQNARSKRPEADAIPTQSGSGRCDTSLALYLRDIGRVKPLTREQEIELSTLVKRGDGEARDQMIKANLALVIRIARSYEGLGVPFLDLISEGNIGLLKAVERFDPSKGAKFSGYGALWIEKAITRALASQGKVVRLPTHVAEKLGKMHRAASRLREEFGREATDEELAAEMGITTLKLSEMRMANSHPASLDAQIDPEDSRSYADVIADERVQMPYERLEAEALLARLRESFDALDRRERTVLRSRFGLNGGRSKTLEQIGQQLSLTDERVRQIQDMALKKLRRRMQNLESYGTRNGAAPCRSVRATAGISACRRLRRAAAASPNGSRTRGDRCPRSHRALTAVTDRLHGGSDEH